MKSINISGTTSEVFRIGEGTNAVDLRVIEGKLYFRNFGDTFKELLSNDADITLSPINWAPSNYYSIGDLIYYNQSLFQVVGNHTSGNNFIYSNNYYRRISNINNLTKINVDAYNNNLYELNILSSNFIHLYGTGVGGFTVKMPDPTSIGIGSQYLLQNNSSKKISIYSNNNFLITELDPNENKIIVLLDYTNIDFWTSLSISTDIINFGLDVRKITFQNNQQYKFIGASGVFLIDKAGKYSFFDSRDSGLNGDIFWTTGGNSCKIITFSDQIVSGDSPQRFCFFNINNDLYIKNNTGINREIVFHSLYQQGS
jgi:hypothetical protein